MTIVNVIGQKMHTSAIKNLAEGSQQFVKFQFHFSKEWDGLKIFAQFRQGDTAYNQYLDDENCVYLPPEIKSGVCTLTLYGSDKTTIGTTNCLELIISENRLLENAASTEITESLYNQLVTEFNQLKKIDQAYSPESENAQSGKAVAEAMLNKVDKIQDKGLSTNDYTNEEKNKLRNVEENANNTVVDQTYSATSENAQSGIAVAEALKTLRNINGTVISENTDYAEVGEWADGNPNNENRIGYFVAIDDNTAGTTMVKAKSTSDIRGVTVVAPAFSGNCSQDKFDTDGNLIKQYDYVATMGLVSVIDNGTCIINGRCMPDDNGCAVPSSNNMGYQVVDRIDDTHILIAVEPNGDMIQRIKTDTTQLQNEKPDKQEVANALRGNKSGSASLIDDISPVEHKMGVKVKSKNLLNPNIYVKGYSFRGVTFSVSGDVITMTGTAEESTYLNVIYQSNPDGRKDLPSELSGRKIKLYAYGNTASVGMILFNDTTNFYLPANENNIVDTTGYTQFGLRLNIVKDETYNDTIRIMVCDESISNNPAYTPYIPDLTAVKVSRCGKNLFDIDNPIYASNSEYNNNNFPKIVDGVIYFNTWYSYTGGLGFAVPMPSNTTFTISFDVVQGEFSTEIFCCESIGTDRIMINWRRFSPTYKNISSMTYTQPNGMNYIVFNLSCVEGCFKCGVKNVQIEVGSVATAYEEYNEIEYTPTADGTVNGITSLYPNTTLTTDTDGVIIDCEYNRDINKAFAELQQAIISLGGNV